MGCLVPVLLVFGAVFFIVKRRKREQEKSEDVAYIHQYEDVKLGPAVLDVNSSEKEVTVNPIYFMEPNEECGQKKEVANPIYNVDWNNV